VLPTRRQLALPSLRVTPLNTCPGLRPRWCPVHSPYRRPDCRFPTQCTASAFTSDNLRLILMTTTIHPPAHRLSFHVCMDLGYWQWRAGISGLNTEPASLLPPASDSRYRFCLRIQLLTCWLNFSQVGLSRTRFRITHWVTITHFMGFLPIPRSRIYLGTSIDGLGKLRSN